MAESGHSRPRASVDGKFFRRGAQKLCLKGVAYGPFMPNAQGEPLVISPPEASTHDYCVKITQSAGTLRAYQWGVRLLG